MAASVDQGRDAKRQGIKAQKEIEFCAGVLLVTLKDVFIVDVDVHVHDLPGAILPYVESAWRPAVAHVVDLPARYLDIPGYCPNSVPYLAGANLPNPKQGARSERVFTAEQMRQELDAMDIDAGVLFPDHLLRIAALPNAGYAAALARAYHRWIDERWVSADNDLYAVIIAAPQDPEEAAREIERWAGHNRFAGVYLPVCQTYPLWGHRRYDPIYDAAQHHDLPVLLHSVSGFASTFPFNHEQFSSTPTTHTISHTFAMMTNLMHMLETGVPVRYPRLRICFAEAGLTWVPFLRMRLDKEYTENRYQWPHLQERPSRYIDAFYFATQPVEEPENRRDLADIIRIYHGEDRTVFASDWPHHDFDHPRVVFNLPVSDAVKRKLMGENALALMPRIKLPVSARGDRRASAG